MEDVLRGGGEEGPAVAGVEDGAVGGRRAAREPPEDVERVGRPGEAGAEVRPWEGFSPVMRVGTQAVRSRGHGCGAANLVASISATGIECGTISE